MTRVVVTLASVGALAVGLVNGAVAATVAGGVGLGLVVLSCRLSARNGEWRTR
jgi:hypothetical protein